MTASSEEEYPAYQDFRTEEMNRDTAAEIRPATVVSKAMSS